MPTIVLGEIVKAVGLRGELKLRESADFWPEALASPALRLVGPRGSSSAVIASERAQGAGARVLQVVGVDDRTAAELLIGSRLEIEADEAGGPGPQALRPFQVRGLRVVGPGGEAIGVVRDLVSMPGQDLLVVEGGAREHLVPCVPEIVLEVDLDSGCVRIAPPPGLLEL